MLIFLIFGIFLFPKFKAQDEIMIYPNKTIHWTRPCEKISINRKGYFCEEPQNTEMKYIIETPQTNSIGKLVKETKIAGCQHITGGCNLLLQLGDGTILFRETNMTKKDKIEIDLGRGHGHEVMF